MEIFDSEWINRNINDPTNSFVIFRKIIPWQKIINRLTQFYNTQKGPFRISLRTVIALFLVSKLRGLSDQKLIEQVQENRYIQYFCNVADEDLLTFIHPSSLTRLRKRYGEKGSESYTG